MYFMATPNREAVMLELILLLIAIVLFVLAAIGRVSTPLNLGWLGMAFFAATFLTPLLG